MTAEESVKKTIEDKDLIDKGDVLVLGLSGGPDSLCLLHILMELRKSFGFVLCALHFNHCLRGEEADADEAFLRDYCRGLDIPLKVVKEDIAVIAKKSGMSVETAGRIRRHAALDSYSRELEKKWNGHPELLPKGACPECVEAAKNNRLCAKVVLAHNADDQAETVLLRIIRGTGVHGIAAMRYKREDGLIRPLLSTPRALVEQYCKDRDLKPRIDKTNEETDYLRNKIRLEIMPRLEELNSGVKNNIARLAENAASDDDYISEKASEWMREHAKGMPPDAEESFSVKELDALSSAVFGRVVKEAFGKIGLTEDISAVHINALKKAVSANTGNKTVEFPKGFTAYINHGEVVLRRHR